MGSWNFYIDLKVDSDDANALLQEYISSDLFQSAFSYAMFPEWMDRNFNVGISGVIDNFLPTNNLIYKFLSKFKKGSLYIRTNGVERFYDFEKKVDFINFMYNVWEERIDSAYSQVGVIIINHKDYYKTRNKLYKKYYKKF